MCPLSDGFGVVGGEQARLAPQQAPPPGLVGAPQDPDDVAGAEPQLVRLLGAETVQSRDPRIGGSFALDTRDETRTDECL